MSRAAPRVPAKTCENQGGTLRWPVHQEGFERRFRQSEIAWRPGERLHGLTLHQHDLRGAVECDLIEPIRAAHNGGALCSQQAQGGRQSLTKSRPSHAQ